MAKGARGTGVGDQSHWLDKHGRIRGTELHPSTGHSFGEHLVCLICREQTWQDQQLAPTTCPGATATGSSRIVGAPSVSLNGVATVEVSCRPVSTLAIESTLPARSASSFMATDAGAVLRSLIDGAGA